MRFEPLYEVTQVKGDGESPSPAVSPNDEFADYENWDVTNLSGNRTQGTVDAAIRIRSLRAQAGPQAR